MQTQNSFTAFLSASGHIFLRQEGEPGTDGFMKLMSGPYAEVWHILSGNFDMFTDMNNENFWGFSPMYDTAESSPEKQDIETYIMLMIFLSRIKKLYKDLHRVTFYINQCGNPDLRRITARAISEAMY